MLSSMKEIVMEMQRSRWIWEKVRRQNKQDLMKDWLYWKRQRKKSLLTNRLLVCIIRWTCFSLRGNTVNERFLVGFGQSKFEMPFTKRWCWSYVSRVQRSGSEMQIYKLSVHKFWQQWKYYLGTEYSIKRKRT